MNFIDTNFDIEKAMTEWKAGKVAEKFYAKWHAGETTDADVAEYHNATAEVTAQTAVEVTAEVTIKTVVEAVAYGADGQVLSYDETVEAIANRQGWFDRQGRWVNYARMMQEARAMLAAN